MNQEDTLSHTPPSEHERPPQTELAAAEPSQVIKIAELQRMSVDDLNKYAHNIGLKNLGALTKSQIVFEIVKFKSERSTDVLVGEGTLEVLPDGFGFLRSPNYNYLPSAEDIYVSPRPDSKIRSPQG